MLEFARLRSTALFIRTLLLLGLLVMATGAAAETEVDSGRENYSSLATLLEDEESRERLIGELRRLAGEQPVSEKEPEPEPEAAPDGGQTDGFATRLADSTRTFAQDLVTEFSASMQLIVDLAQGRAELASDLTAKATPLTILILVTAGIFLLLRLLARGAFARLSHWTRQEQAASPLLRCGMAVVGAIVVDSLVIVAAWIGGYLFALFALGESGEIDNGASLFLNAFLGVEAFKMLMRALFASRDDGLRLLPMEAEEAAYWNAWLARLAGFIGYGLLFAVPLADNLQSPALGSLMSVVIMLLAFLYALTVILQNRDRVADRLRRRTQITEMAFNRILLSMLARSWHWLAIAYFAVLSLVTMLRPEDALPFMLTATAQTMLAIGGGIFLSVVLSQIIHRQLRLADRTRQRFPYLEQRLNAYIPTALKVMRLLIMVVVTLVLLDAWRVFDLPAWLTSDAGLATLATAVTVALVLLGAVVVWIALASWIELRLTPEATGRVAGPREKTLLSIFRNAIAVALSVITIMVVLAEIGINIGPLIAGAGVLGLAIGFGSQKLVQDIITGVFIQLENAINTGDIVTASGVTGEVEKLTIRSLGLRDLAGTYHIIPFSAVDTVSNYMRGFAYHLAEYGVAYREDVDEVMECLRAAFTELKTFEEFDGMLLEEELEIPGVTKFDDSSVNIRVRIKTAAGMQWAVGRAFNRLVKRHFDAADIEIPFPHTTLYFGQNKDGSAPPAFVDLKQSQESKDHLPAANEAKDEVAGDHGSERGTSP